MPDVSDVSHWFGGDLALSPTGDLALVGRADRSRQRVLRRLMTAEGDYLPHPLYGSGLPQQVGETFELAKVRAEIVGQMRREVSVDQANPPSVTVAQIANGVEADIRYVVAPEQIPAVLSFEQTSGLNGD